MAKLRATFAFTRLSDGDLSAFAENVVTQMTGNASFPTPLIGLDSLKSALTAFRAALAAAATGARDLVAAKAAPRKALEGLLRQEAAYVQGVAGDDPAILLSSGFDAASSSKVSLPLDKPVIAGIENEATTQLRLRVQAVLNARAYEVRISYGSNGWQAAGVFTQARRIVLTNLTPGTVYNIQVRAVGGSTGYSDWSDPVSHMAT
jgi:hypothetical protein